MTIEHKFDIDQDFVPSDPITLADDNSKVADDPVWIRSGMLLTFDRDPNNARAFVRKTFEGIVSPDAPLNVVFERTPWLWKGQRVSLLIFHLGE